MPKDEPKKFETKPIETKRPTHRLFCQACTGIAMFYTEGDELPKSVKCHACGAPQIVSRVNLIKL